MEKTEVSQAITATLDLSEAKSLRIPAAPESDLLKDWSKADLEWRKGLPPIMHGVAATHGRMLYQYIMGAGIFNDALAQLVRRLRGNREMEHCLVSIQSQMQVYAMHVHDTLIANGKTLADMQTAKLDIERAMTLATSATSKIPS